MDADTTQRLEVEAYTPADWKRKLRRDADVALASNRNSNADRRTYDVERIVTTFGFEKNGMRFPSHVEIKSTRTTINPGAVHEETRDSTLRKVTQDYRRFEFFSVQPSDEIIRLVNGDGTAAPAP